MTARATAKRVPSKKGFEEIISKSLSSIVEEKKRENVLSPPPKDFMFVANYLSNLSSTGSIQSTLQSEEFPLCCGARILYGFPYAGEKSKWETVEKRMNRLISKAEYSNKGLIMLILNDSQEKGEGKALLEKLLFKKVFRASNPSHQNTSVLNLWCLNLGSKNFNEHSKGHIVF